MRTILLTISVIFLLPAFAECPIQKDGDECEKGIRRSSRLPKNLPVCTKHFDEGRFGEQISEGGYASAGFAEAVKMPRAEARGASLVGTPIYSQMVVQKLSAATPALPSLVATEEEVRRFFDQYVERYNQRDLDGFLLLFSLKTIQNQQDGLLEMKKLYADVFNRSQKLQISIEDIKIEIYQNAVDVKARYTVNQVLKETGGKRFWKGDIHWVLVKEEGILKITSIDFRHSVPPALVLEGEPKPKEEPAGKALVKPEVPVGVKKASPQVPPLLAEEEEVKRFFSNYIDQYHKKDIDGFLSFFSPKALQNQKDGLERIRKIYTKYFDQSQDLRYHVEGMKIEIYQNMVEVKARFRVDQRLKRRGEEKVWEGNIRWVLVKEDGNLKISSLDYQNEKTP